MAWQNHLLSVHIYNQSMGKAQFYSSSSSSKYFNLKLSVVLYIFVSNKNTSVFM